MTLAHQKGTVALISLGCPKNLVDTEHMLGQFIHQGYALTTDPEKADLLVINTCGFKADAVKESKEAILAMATVKADHPGKRLVVTGCLAQRYGTALLQKMPNIDILIGSTQYDQLIPLIESPQPNGQPGTAVTPPSEAPRAYHRVLTTSPQTAYVKIAEGCNNPCSFCIIPQLRGRFRSRALEDIENEVTTLGQQGIQEINLVSQDTTLYGRDLSPRTSLAELLRRLARIPNIAWIRTLYLYPTLITTDLLEVMASEEKILPYLDMPLQHSHSAVLKRMKRVERTEDIQHLLHNIQTYLPHATLRTTFIVGFPGESHIEFQHLYDFVAQGWFDHVGVFTYSDEKEASAYHLRNKVSKRLAKKRRGLLMGLQQEVSYKKLKKWIGHTLPVLVEGKPIGVEGEPHGDLRMGRSMGQAPDVDGTVFIQKGKPKPGAIVPVTITDTFEYDLAGYTI